MKYDPERRDWSVLTKTRGGTVSLVKALTLAEAITVYERLDPEYGHYLSPGQNSWSRYTNDGDIELREILGPEGWSEGDQPLPHWPRSAERTG